MRRRRFTRLESETAHSVLPQCIYYMYEQKTESRITAAGAADGTAASGVIQHEISVGQAGERSRSGTEDTGRGDAGEFVREGRWRS